MPKLTGGENQPHKIYHLFEAQSKIQPSKTAITLYKQKLTYKELDTKANQFARYLIEQGVKPGDIIPIVTKKSLLLFIAMLGILKAGAAYSPLNQDSPDKHIESVIKETGAKFACIATDLLNRFSLGEINIIQLDQMDELIDHYPGNDLDEIYSASDLAYVIYTSGTTGNPKGGMIAHGNLLPTYYSWEETYGLSNTDIHLQMAPVGFDVFAGDWIRALCSGATLVLCPKDVLIDSEKLSHFISREKINCAEFVPAILRQLVNFVEKNNYHLRQFRLLICGSDQWTMKEYRAVKKLCHKEARVISSYGVTETTIDSSFYEEETENSLNDTSTVPIGKPFNHVKIYLINDDKLAEPGETGEIYIGGTGVGLGYLNQPILTADKFVTKIILNGLSERLYRTGDQGKKLSDDNFLFLGRNQEHIKINGQRVDLPSLESVINQHPKIKFGMVTPVLKPHSDEVTLNCFLKLTDESLSFDEFTAYLSRELPCYYMPKKFYQVDAIPLSLNGKVDRNISSQKIIKELKPEFHPPKDDMQKYLITLWQEILGIEELGINNNFYYLGGSSLLFAAMLEKINQYFNVNLLLTVEYETIENLANHITEAQSLSMTESCKVKSFACPSSPKNRYSWPTNQAFFSISAPTSPLGQQHVYYSSLRANSAPSVPSFPISSAENSSDDVATLEENKPLAFVGKK